MTFCYNPKDAGDEVKSYPAGNYPFRVFSVQETVFGSGNEGWKVILMVDVGEGKEIKVFENFINTPSALWKFRTFCHAFGLDFDNPPIGGWTCENFENLDGSAYFKPNEKGYLSVYKFDELEVPEGLKMGTATTTAANNVPF